MKVPFETRSGDLKVTRAYCLSSERTLFAARRNRRLMMAAAKMTFAKTMPSQGAPT